VVQAVVERVIERAGVNPRPERGRRGADDLRPSGIAGKVPEQEALIVVAERADVVEDHRPAPGGRQRQRLARKPGRDRRVHVGQQKLEQILRHAARADEEQVDTRHPHRPQLTVHGVRSLVDHVP
jgi:hypothetical protein